MNKYKVGYIVNYEGGSQFFREWQDVVELFCSQKSSPPLDTIEVKRCVYIKEPSSTEGFHELIGWKV